MRSIQHIQNALLDLDKEVENILSSTALNLTQKDNSMMPLLLQKRVLVQTLKDLEYLQDNPPTPNQPCKVSRFRE